MAEGLRERALPGESKRGPGGQPGPLPDPNAPLASQRRAICRRPRGSVPRGLFLRPRKPAILSTGAIGSLHISGLTGESAA